MEMNSIKTNLSKEDIISEIKLFINADIKKEQIFLILEGDDDIKFWKNIVNKNVIIFDSYSGKEGIKEIIENYFSNTFQVIGIRDKDYENNNIHPQIFYYDYCCLEIMIISNDEAFTNIYNEYYNGKLSPNELRLIILKELKYLSLIRKCSEINKLGIKVNAISIFNIFNKKTKKIDNNEIISTLNKINTKTNDIQHKIDQEFKIDIKYENFLNITQGHDFIALFTAFCNKGKGANPKDKNIAASLRCAYRKTDFQKTKIYSDLTCYESKHLVKILY